MSMQMSVILIGRVRTQGTGLRKHGRVGRGVLIICPGTLLMRIMDSASSGSTRVAT
jgi:hypothetical protein